MLAYLWAAYPFTLYALSSNSNDSLVAMLLVLAMLVITSAPARGVATALAGFAKFAPLILFPLFARGEGSTWPPKRKLVAFTGAFALTAVIVMLPVILDNNFHTFWHDSLEYQIDRTSPFSVWGLWGGLSVEQHLVQAFAVALAIARRLLPPPPDDRRDSRARRRHPDRLPARPDLLVLPLHPVVLPAGDRGADRGLPERDRLGAAAGRCDSCRCSARGAALT